MIAPQPSLDRSPGRSRLRHPVSLAGVYPVDGSACSQPFEAVPRRARDRPLELNILSSGSAHDRRRYPDVTVLGHLFRNTGNQPPRDRRPAAPERLFGEQKSRPNWNDKPVCRERHARCAFGIAAAAHRNVPVNLVHGFRYGRSGLQVAAGTRNRDEISGFKGSDKIVSARLAEDSGVDKVAVHAPSDLIVGVGCSRLASGQPRNRYGDHE